MRIAWSAVVMLLFVACSLVTPGISAYNEGVQHQARGEKFLAEQLFTIALQSQPDLAEAHLNLGALYDDDGLIDAAEAETQQSIAILERTKTTLVEGSTYQQTLSMAYTNLGRIQAERANASFARFDFVESQQLQTAAMASYKRAVALDPTNVRAQAVLKAVAP
jgi:tetratricopeptide (TPR) repeat protein